MTAPANSLGELRRKVSDRLADALDAITDLQRELEEARSENRELARERERAERALVQLDVLKMERAEAASRLHADIVEQKRLRAELNALEDERDDLADRCRRLEQRLLGERKQREAAEAELRFLAAQVEQLQAMVALLSGEQA